MQHYDNSHSLDRISAVKQSEQGEAEKQSNT